MAKGTIKSASGAPVGTVNVNVTVTPGPGAPIPGPVNSPTPVPQPVGNPPADIITGQLQDNDNPNLLINFVQPYGIELGIAVGAKVNYQTATVNGQALAISVRLLQRGEIQVINSTNDGGILLDKATGNRMVFAQANCIESGLVAATPTTKGTMVHFETVIDPTQGVFRAVALEIIGG